MAKIPLTDEAQALLPHQFANSKKFKALLNSLTQPFQEALETIEALKTSLYIDLAQGDTLDTIGAIVKQPRKGMSDTDYRPWLKVRILLNNNSGTAEDIKRILAVLYNGLGEFELHESPGHLTVYLNKPPVFTNQDVIQSIIKEAVPIGIKTRIQVA